MAQTIDFNASSFILHLSSFILCAFVPLCLCGSFLHPSAFILCAFVPLCLCAFVVHSFFLLPSSFWYISQKNRVDLCHPTYINNSHLNLEGESRSDRTSDDIAIIFVLVRSGDPNHTRSNRNIVSQL
jgi:hypothetical protein